MLFRERKFMLLVSDTESQAALFLGTFRQELQDNQDLINIFGVKRDPETGRVRFIKDSETDIIVEMEDGHLFRIIAKGAEQKLRGLIWSGSRPDIIICDDFENDELVLNKDRRDKFRRWFKGALLPSRSDTGIVRIVGTVLHMDSMLERFMPPLSDPYTVTEGLKQYSRRRTMWKAVKYRAHDVDFEELLWPEKKSADEFKMMYEEAKADGTVDIYSQEYLNYPIDESVSYFKKGDMTPMTQDDRAATMNYYITADLAISLTDRADFSAFVVGGVDEHKKLHILHVIRERMDGREIVDTLLALQRTYEPQAVGIEDMQVSKSIGPFLREEMVLQNTYLNLVLLKHGGKDKLMRGRSIQARMRAKGVKFDKEADWYPKLEEELLQFPRSKHDDQMDCLAYLGLMLDKLIEAPTAKEQEHEDRLLEMEEAELNHEGQSAVTGY
jgi:predicted phage terminase large subunit-like protein